MLLFSSKKKKKENKDDVVILPCHPIKQHLGEEHLKLRQSTLYTFKCSSAMPLQIVHIRHKGTAPQIKPLSYLAKLSFQHPNKPMTIWDFPCTRNNQKTSVLVLQSTRSAEMSNQHFPQTSYINSTIQPLLTYGIQSKYFHQSHGPSKECYLKWNFGLPNTLPRK